MPTFTYHGSTIPYASEQEVLNFANAVRQGGGGEVIQELFPGTPEEPKACLIANALNFSTKVEEITGYEAPVPKDEMIWGMVFPSRTRKAEAQKIADAVGCPVRKEGSCWAIVLPRLIGNTAHAFDNAKRGWVTKYRKES